jgi:hypothetical protein
MLERSRSTRCWYASGAVRCKAGAICAMVVLRKATRAIGLACVGIVGGWYAVVRVGRLRGVRIFFHFLACCTM